jgi:hypothetical protein
MARNKQEFELGASEDQPMTVAKEIHRRFHELSGPLETEDEREERS